MASKEEQGVKYSTEAGRSVTIPAPHFSTTIYMAFEEEAVASESTLRKFYVGSKSDDGETHEMYRQVILKRHIERQIIDAKGR